MGTSRLTAYIAVLALAGCTAAPTSTEFTALDAAQNCTAQGGKRVAERGGGGEIGVCVFPDGRQCEEWALLLGRCARGGIVVRSYATTTERHCAIRGGQMTIPGCALNPVGMYETRNVRLVLLAGRTAMLRTGYSEIGGQSLVPGTWESSGNVVTVSTDLERLVFDYTGDRLVARQWDRKAWGPAGPGTLLRQ